MFCPTSSLHQFFELFPIVSILWPQLSFVKGCDVHPFVLNFAPSIDLTPAILGATHVNSREWTGLWCKLCCWPFLRRIASPVSSSWCHHWHLYFFLFFFVCDFFLEGTSSSGFIVSALNTEGIDKVLSLLSSKKPYCQT